MPRGLRVFLAIFGTVFVLGITFWFGKFTTWFNLNLCYSEVINLIATEASSVAESQDPDKVKMFQNLVRSLPLHGYETECKEVQGAISKYKSASNLPPPKT